MQVFFHTARVKRELAHISPVLYPQGSHSWTTTHACDGLGFRSHFYSRISTTIRSHPGRPVHRSLQLAKDVFLALPVKNDAVLRMATNFSKHLLSWCSIRWQIADKVCTIWVGYLQEWSSKEGKTISWGIGWLL